MRGRPKVPDAMKEQRGYFRPNSRHVEGLRIDAERVNMPNGMPPKAKQAWKSFYKRLQDVNVMTKLDSFALEMLCRSVHLYYELWDIVAEQGMTFEMTNKEGNTIIKAHPALAQLNAQWDCIHKMLIQFGLTPAARTRVTPTTEIKKENDIDKLLGIKPN